MIAKDLLCISGHLLRSREGTHSPNTLIMLRFRGNSLAYPIFASAASALGSVVEPLRPMLPVTELLLRRSACILSNSCSTISRTILSCYVATKAMRRMRRTTRCNATRDRQDKSQNGNGSQVQNRQGTRSNDVLRLRGLVLSRPTRRIRTPRRVSKRPHHAGAFQGCGEKGRDLEIQAFKLSHQSAAPAPSNATL